MYMYPTIVGIKSGSPDAFLEEPLSGMLKAKILESQIIQDVPGGGQQNQIAKLGKLQLARPPLKGYGCK